MLAGDHLSGPREAAPLRIVAWPKTSPANVYVSALYDAMAHSAEVGEFEPSAGFVAKASELGCDIVHVHWLERPFWGGGGMPRIGRRVIHALRAIAKLKRQGAKLVWTAHDPFPHEMAANDFQRSAPLRVLWGFYRRVVLRQLDGIILLSECHRDTVAPLLPRPSRVQWAVVPHPHYRGQYPDEITPVAARESLGLADDSPVLGFVGNLRRYKNPDGLMRAFAGSAARLQLLVAGKPDSAPYQAELEAIARTDARIVADFSFIPDADLQRYLRAADGMVFPFRDVTNSGSALLALSFGRPLAVPDVPIFRELRDQVGTDWVYLYPEPLTPADIDAIAAWIGRPRASAPDLSRFDWDRIAAQTLSFFHQLAAGSPHVQREGIA